MATLSTNNWDTAFGIKFKDANKAIIEKSSSPKSFNGTHNVSGTIYTVSSNFGNWQMSGGSGSYLEMSLPLIAGTVSGGLKSENFAGSASIRVRLDFIPKPGVTNTQLLKVDSTESVTVLNVILTSGPDSGVDSIKGALQDWLQNNMDQFNHVFAAVDLNDEVDTDDFSWLKPTHLGYAINTEGFSSVDDYIFGILAMTENRKGKNLTPVLDPMIISKDADAGFLISAQRVIDKMFTTHIEEIFANEQAGDFDTLDDGMSIYNKKELMFNEFVLEDGTKISGAKVDSDGFNFSIGSGSIVIQFNGLQFTWKTGYTITVNYRSVNELSTDENGHLQLKPTGKPTLSVAVSESDSEKWKEIWEGIGLGILVAIVGAVLGGIADAALAARAAARAAAEAAAEAGAQAGGDAVQIELQTILDELTPADRIARELANLRETVQALQNPEAAVSFSSFFRVNALKFLGAAIGATIGGSISGVVTALQAYTNQDKENMPTLANFASKAIDNTTWPGGTYKLASAKLNGALQMSLIKKV
jgi:hypothetical protein